MTVIRDHGLCIFEELLGFRHVASFTDHWQISRRPTLESLNCRKAALYGQRRDMPENADELSRSSRYFNGEALSIHIVLLGMQSIFGCRNHIYFVQEENSLAGLLPYLLGN